MFRSLNLSGRTLVDGPFFQPSDESQWIQIADIVAHAAYQAVIRRPGREFCRSWFEDSFCTRSAHNTPTITLAGD